MDEIQHVKKRAFLAAYQRCASITVAAKRSKVDRASHYVWMQNDPVYAAAFKEAKLRAGDALEDEASRRAFAGSDVLLIFLLKGFKPNKYKDRQAVEHGGIDGEPIQINVSAKESLARRIASIAERNRQSGSSGAAD